MDILFFLKERTKFIRHYYLTAAEPFCETMRKIEAEEIPYNDPPYSEDGVPAFLAEWLEADVALETLGRSCISMLSASLQLYFKAWEKELGVSWGEGERKRAFRNGFLNGYRICFEEVLKTLWDDCPANLEILEQIILARNHDQHPDHITTIEVRHSQADREKYKQLFFIRDTERGMLADSEMTDFSWMTQTVHVSREGLFLAISQVEILAEWLEERMLAARYPGVRRSRTGQS